MDRKTVLLHINTMQNAFDNMSAENEVTSLATVSFVETEIEREETFEPGFYHQKITLDYDNTIVYVSFDTFEGQSCVESAVYDKRGLSNEDIEWIDSEIKVRSEEWANKYNESRKLDSFEIYF